MAEGSSERRSCPLFQACRSASLAGIYCSKDIQRMLSLGVPLYRNPLPRSSLNVFLANKGGSQTAHYVVFKKCLYKLNAANLEHDLVPGAFMSVSDCVLKRSSTPFPSVGVRFLLVGSGRFVYYRGGGGVHVLLCTNIFFYMTFRRRRRLMFLRLWRCRATTWRVARYLFI